LKYKPSVQPVELGSEAEFKDVEHGRPCRIVGHGKISNNPGDNEDELQVGSQVHAGTDGVTCAHFIPGSTNCFLTKGLS